MKRQRSILTALTCLVKRSYCDAFHVPNQQNHALNHVATFLRRPCAFTQFMSFVHRTNALSASNQNGIHTATHHGNSISERTVQDSLLNNVGGQDKVTVFNILQATISLLEAYEAPEPMESTCHLLAFTLKNEFKWEDNGFSILFDLLEGKSRGQYLKDVILTSDELNAFSNMIARRIDKEPLQYIIGQWDFHNILLKIRSPCLCPRPETEELVEYALSDIRRMIRDLRSQNNPRKVRVLDVGCGTGAIGIAILNMFPQDVSVVAIDVAQVAVDLSRENANFVLGSPQESCDYKVVLRSTRDFEPKEMDFDEFDIVVSNPPYIPSRDMSTLSEDVLDFEDYNALCGGDDGLDVVRDILRQLPQWCQNQNANEKPFHSTCWMELDSSHPSIMSLLVENYPGVSFVQSLKDMSGLDRFVQVEVLSK
jgi:release factor glutamine methyltransferase